MKRNIIYTTYSPSAPVSGGIRYDGVEFRRPNDGPAPSGCGAPDSCRSAAEAVHSLRMSMRFLLLLAAAVFLAACAGAGRKADSNKETKAAKDTTAYYAARINRHIYSGRQDSVIIEMTPHFYRALSARDTVVCRLLGVSIAQAWLELENRDSVSRYIDRLHPYMAGVEGGSAFIIYHNVLGGYALKYQADYSGALSHFLKVLDYAKKQEIIPAQIGMLYNIIYIFYIREDPHCEQYAEQALTLSEYPGVSFFTRIAALIAKTESEYLNGSLDEASRYLRQAHEKSLEHNTGYWNPIIYLLKGDILTAQGLYDKAAQSYEMALCESPNSEPSIVINILYNYGNLRRATGELQKATELYGKALEKCRETGSTEYLIQLLRGMVEVCSRTGAVREAVHYCNALLEQSDRLNFLNGSSDFKNQLYEYSSLQYEYDLMRQSLELSENRRTTALLAFFISVAALGAAFVLLLYARQRRENKRLIAQYEEYRKRLLTENSVNDRTAADHRSDIHYALYLKMEQLMKSGLFREKELTLDRMAEVLGTNRTYVSNALNKVAGISFYGYIDSYRIKEATRVLSDPELAPTVSLKQLADDVGYNNIQTFFKAFKRETGVTPGNYKKELLNLHKFTQSEQ